MSDREPTSKLEAALQHAVKCYQAALVDPGSSAAAYDAFLSMMDRYGFAIVVAYDSQRSIRHPLGQIALDAIGKVFEDASRKHGHTETWMAVYNECVRQGEQANPTQRLRIVTSDAAQGQTPGRGGGS